MTRVVRSNLPRRPFRRLVGRDADLSEVLTWTRNAGKGAPSVAVIVGPSGVGKTALALEAGHAVLSDATQRRFWPRRRFRFDAIIWASAQPRLVTLGGVSSLADRVLSLDDLVDQIAIVLHRGDILRAAAPTRVQMALEALGTTRALLIVDNLEAISDASVPGFLLRVPETSRVLATGVVPLSSGHIFQLQPLGFLPTLDLLADVTGNSESAGRHDLSVLAVASSGLPLAAVWLVNLLAEGQTIDQAKAELADPTADVIQFCFRRFDTLLEGRAADLLLQMLAVCEQDTLLADAQEMLSGFIESKEFPVATAYLGKHLGLVQLVGGSISMVPLARSYALGRLKSSGQLEEVYVSWFLHWIHYCDDSFAASTWQPAFDRLDSKFISISTAIDWGREQTEDRVQNRAAHTVAKLGYYLFARGLWNHLLRHAPWAAERLLDDGENERYLELVAWQVRVYIHQGDLAGALRVWSDANRRLAARGTVSRLCDGLLRFTSASIARRSGLVAESVTQLKSAIQSFAAVGRPDLEAGAYLRLGNTYAAAAEFHESEVAYRVADSLLSDAADPSARECKALAVGNLGILANRRLEHSSAIPLLQAASTGIVQTYDRAVLNMELGLASYGVRRRSDAKRYGRYALTLAASLGYTGPVAESHPLWEREILPSLIAGGPVAAFSNLRHEIALRFRRGFRRP